jgi:predicted MFS family arabinose efflux permease
VGIINILLAHTLLKETPIKAETRLDARGFALATLAFPSILFGLSEGADSGWGSPYVVALLVIGFSALVAFVVSELRHHDPLLRIQLFRDPMFRLAIFIQWIGFFSLFGLNFLMPLVLQRVQGMGPAAAGRVLLPMGIVAFVSMNVAGRMYKYVGPRPLVMSGLAVLAVTTFLWSRVNADTSSVLLMVIVSFRGLGLGLFAQNIQLVAYNTVPQGEMPRATALVNVGQRVDGALSSAILTTVLVAGLRWAGAPAGTSIAEGNAPVDLMMEAFRDAFWLMTALSCIGLVLAFFVHDRVLEEEKARVARVGAQERAAVEPLAGMADD